MPEQLPLPTLQFSLREICQTSSINHLVAYTASVELHRKNLAIALQVESYKPEDAEADLLALAIQATREGFSEVLTPLQLGAHVSINQLILHPVDFSRFYQHRYSAQYLRAALVTAGILR